MENPPGALENYFGRGKAGSTLAVERSAAPATWNVPLVQEDDYLLDSWLAGSGWGPAHDHGHMVQAHASHLSWWNLHVET